MGKAVKCPACKSFYNGQLYTKCPYCNETAAKTDSAGTETEEKKTGMFSFWGKRNTVKPPKNDEKKEEKEEPQEQPVVPKQMEQGEEEGIPHTVPMDDSILQNEDSQQVISKTTAMQETTPHTVPLNDEPVKAAGIEPNTPAKRSDKSTPSLSQSISRSGRTVGKYISNSSGESIAPVVGWLVGVKGACYGQSFNLKSGRNKIGRSHEMDVKLLNDDSVSRTSVAVIVFDAKGGEFSILPGESDSLCYVNESALYERKILSGYEEIEFGDKSLNKYIFVPFCGERFQWSAYSQPQQG